jgi:hypothetical protein
MKDDETLKTEESQFDAEMRVLIGTDDSEIPYPTHDAWRELGSHVRTKANESATVEHPQLKRLLIAASFFAVALLAIALSRPPQQTVEMPAPESAPEALVAEPASSDGFRELSGIDAFMQQIELDELAIDLRDSGVVDDVQEAFGLLREYGVDEDRVFDEYVNAL